MKLNSLLTANLLLAASLIAQSNKLAPDLAGFDPNDNIDVIIQLEDTPAPRPGAPRPARPAALGGVNLASQRPVRELGLINGLAARLPAAALASLAADPRVKYISPDRPLTAATQNAIPAVNATAAQAAGFDGNGIGIAVIDSGINSHPDLMDATCKTTRIRYRQDFAPASPPRAPGASSPLAADTPDFYGHGTHVAGILAGNGRCTVENNGGSTVNGLSFPKQSFIGVAPQAHLIDLRVLNAVGQGNDSAVIQAIDRAIALRNQYNIRIINLSLGRPVKESHTLDPLGQAVARAWNAGITVVVAAGNRGRTESVTDKKGKSYRIDGYGTIGSPANHPLAITVGAMRDMGTPSRQDDLITSYSSKGPTGIDRLVKPDLVAPGNRLLSARSSVPYFQVVAPCSVPFSTVSHLFDDYCQFGQFLESHFPENRPASVRTAGLYVGQVPANFTELSGTSMAAPMVAGAAALLLQKTPTLTPISVNLSSVVCVDDWVRRGSWRFPSSISVFA